MMKRLCVIFLLFLLLVMSFGSTAYLNPQQLRASMVYKQRNYSSSSVLVKGNSSSSALNLFYTDTSYVTTRDVVRGNPDITMDDTTLSVSGDLTSTKSIAYRTVRTYAQTDAYISGIPINQRISRTNGDSISTQLAYDLDRNQQVPIFSTMENNDQFIRIERPSLDITAFLKKEGSITSIPFNDTGGNVITQVLSYRILLTILLYYTSTEQFVGYHSTIEAGYGSTLPTYIITYLNNGTISRGNLDSVTGQEQLSTNTTQAEWIALGYNETYGLDLYTTGYQVHKSSTTLLIDPSAISSGVSLSAVPLGIEALVFELEQANSVMELGDDEVDELDTDLADMGLQNSPFEGMATPTVLSTNNENKTTDGKITGISDLQIIAAAQTLVLLGFGIILMRRWQRV